jgi:hypothetical protein
MFYSWCGARAGRLQQELYVPEFAELSRIVSLNAVDSRKPGFTGR